MALRKRSSRRRSLRKTRRQNGGLRWARKNRTLRKNKRQRRRKQRGG
jgi:hypothetical protein